MALEGKLYDLSQPPGPEWKPSKHARLYVLYTQCSEIKGQWASKKQCDSDFTKASKRRAAILCPVDIRFFRLIPPSLVPTGLISTSHIITLCVAV